jgi:hypothetical protein
MRYISFIVLAVILVSWLLPIASANSCSDLIGSYEIYAFDANQQPQGPKVNLNLELAPDLENGVGSVWKFTYPGGKATSIFSPTPDGTIDGVWSVSPPTIGLPCSQKNGTFRFWVTSGENCTCEGFWTCGQITSDSVKNRFGSKSPSDRAIEKKASIQITTPDEIMHPLAIEILVTEDDKPVPNAKLKVHAFNLPDNDKKLAEYFLVSSCTNCNEGHTTIDGKTISTLCPYEVGLNLPCPLKEQKKPLNITTDTNGQARMEFFLPLGKADAILPSRNSPIIIPINVEYWKADSNGKEIKAAEKKHEAKLSGIAVVQEILYLAPQDFEGNGNKLMRSSGLLSNWAGDDGVKDGDIILKGVDRVKINKIGMLGPNPEGRTAGSTLAKGELLSIGDTITINADGMVSGVRGPINPLVESAIPVGAPGNILTVIRFFDGGVGAVQVDGEVPKHVVKIGETPSSSGFETMPEKLIGLTADFAMDKVNPISQIKSGIKNGVKALVPDSGFFFFIMKVKSKGESLGILDTVGKPVYIRVQSAIVTSYNNSSQLLVTTREGQATIFTEATDEGGFAVPAGKTAVINDSLLPILEDTDAMTAQEADDLLAVLEDPMDTSPVFSGPGNASGGASSGTNGATPGSRGTGASGSGNETAGNATSGANTPGSATTPSASGPSISAGGIAAPSNNNQIGDAAEVGIGLTITQSINPAGSSNFYRFHAASPGLLKLRLENAPAEMKPEMSLYDKNFAYIVSKSAANPGDSLTLEKDLSGPAWYYIEVKDGNGKAHSEPYSLKITFKASPDRYEPNPNFLRAVEVQPGEGIEGYICPVNDEDFYKIYADTSGILKLKLDSVPADMKSELTLYDKGFGYITSSIAANPGDSLSLEKDLQGPGWFFIKVRDADGKAHSEPYSLAISLKSAPDQNEPNPNFFRATETAMGQGVTAYICPVNDEDFYKFYVNGQQIVSLRLDGVPADMKGELTLYDKSFGYITSSTAANPGDKVKLEKDVKGPGWFFIKVRDVNGKAHVEQYSMTIGLGAGA